MIPLDLDDLSQIQTYPAGRVCAHRRCDTVLSIYNPGEHCGLHIPEPPLRYHGKSFAICRCGEVISARAKSGMCPACAREHRREQAERERQRPTSLRRDGRPDAIQRAQMAIRQRLGLEAT